MSATDKEYKPKIPRLDNEQLEPNQFNKPEEAALNRILISNDCSPIGTIIHLAWKCGLMRNEISLLKWSQVDFENKKMELEDRVIPISEETLSYLNRLYLNNKNISEYVLLSLRKSAPMAEQSISRIARRAFDFVGQTNVKLSDLRFDYITRLLKDNDWEYVSYIAGINQPSLREHYLPYIEKSSLRYSRSSTIDDKTRNKLQMFLKDSNNDNCGIALKFICEMGIPVTELPSLTWDVVNIDNCELYYNSRVIPISSDTTKALKEIKKANENKDPHIFLTENTKKPMDYPYLQRIIFKGLVRNGILGVNLKDLYIRYWQDKYDEADSETVVSNSVMTKLKLEKFSKELVNYLQIHRFADFKTLQHELGLSYQETEALLQKNRSDEKTELIGKRYFLKGEIVPKDKQHEVILDYVKKNQPVTSKELTELLGLAERRQIFSIIKPLLNSGELVRRSVNKYYLGLS